MCVRSPASVGVFYGSTENVLEKKQVCRGMMKERVLETFRAVFKSECGRYLCRSTREGGQFEPAKVASLVRKGEVKTVHRSAGFWFL